MSDQTEEGGLPCSPDTESGASEGESEAVGVRSGAGWRRGVCVGALDGNLQIKKDTQLMPQGRSYWTGQKRRDEPERKGGRPDVLDERGAFARAIRRRSKRTAVERIEEVASLVKRDTR
jgi:hypothetical protein